MCTTGGRQSVTGMPGNVEQLSLYRVNLLAENDRLPESEYRRDVHMLSSVPKKTHGIYLRLRAHSMRYISHRYGLVQPLASRNVFLRRAARVVGCPRVFHSKCPIFSLSLPRGAYVLWVSFSLLGIFFATFCRSFST